MSILEWLSIACEALLIWVCVLLGVSAFGLYWLLLTGSLPL
jgi:hypothetical protein